MSYREARNFCEIMRSLGFSRIISIENFRIPNFKLVAEILYWFIHRYDQKADIPDEIDDEKDRVNFIIYCCKYFWVNLKLKLNLKKVYASDSSCVSELLKIAETFYNAKNVILLGNDVDFTSELDLTSKNKEIKDLKELSSTIVETGLNVNFN